MTHLPLTLGDHTTALGPVTFTRIGKGGKWAFDADGCPWSVATGVHGKHFKNPRWDITGRVEPARDAYIDRAALGAWIAKTVGRGGWGNNWLTMASAGMKSRTDGTHGSQERMNDGHLRD